MKEGILSTGLTAALIFAWGVIVKVIVLPH